MGMPGHRVELSCPLAGLDLSACQAAVKELIGHVQRGLAEQQQ